MRVFGREAARLAINDWVVEEIASEPVTLRLDRPFLFTIRDRQTGSVLFLGRVLDPHG